MTIPMKTFHAEKLENWTLLFLEERNVAYDILCSYPGSKALWASITEMILFTVIEVFLACSTVNTPVL